MASASSCKLCNNLTVSDEILLEYAQQSVTTESWIGTLYDFKESAKLGCIICSAVQQAATYFARRIWKSSTPEHTRINVLRTFPAGDCAEVTVRIKDRNDSSDKEHLKRKLPISTSSCSPDAFQFELCPTEGMDLDFIYDIPSRLSDWTHMTRTDN